MAYKHTNSAKMAAHTWYRVVAMVVVAVGFLSLGALSRFKLADTVPKVGHSI